MLKDYLGKAIKIGDKLVYPVRRGSDMYLRTLVVNAVTKESIHGINDKGSTVQIKITSRCVIIER